MTFRSFCAAGTLIAAFASTAAAQFTSVVVPPRQPRVASAGPAQTGSSAAAHARRDTSVVARLTDMKAWVDSAAGLSAPRAVASAQDSSARAAAASTPTTQRADSTARPRSGQTAGTQTFREGATAPNTASPLPLIALFGAGTLLAGLALLHRGVRVPVRRRR